MTIQEFKQLTGIDVTLDQYEEINHLYMLDDTQSKQDFCKCFVDMNLLAYVNHELLVKGELETLRREKFEAEQSRDMWRDEYIKIKERAAVLEARINRIAEIVK